MKNKQEFSNTKMQAKDEELKKLARLSHRELLMELRTSPQGLTEEDAKQRIEVYGPNEVAIQKPTPWYMLLLKSFKNPFVYVLALLLVVSALTGDYDGAAVMGVMIFASVTIHFYQEFRSQKASEALKEMIENTCAVTRNGVEREIPMDEVVPGDVVSLSTGDMIPADAILTWTRDLFVNQSSLTGESMPVEKQVNEDQNLDNSIKNKQSKKLNTTKMPSNDKTKEKK